MSTSFEVDVVASWMPPSRSDEALAWLQATAFDHRGLPALPGALAALEELADSRWLTTRLAPRPAGTSAPTRAWRITEGREVP